MCTQLQVSCEEAEEYKRAYRPQLKALAEAEGRLGVGPELLFVYLRPGPVDALAKGPAKVGVVIRLACSVVDRHEQDITLCSGGTRLVPRCTRLKS